MKRRLLLIFLTLGLIATAGYAYRGMRRRPQVVLPDFVDPADGPRAPHTRAMGIEVGRSSFAAVRSLVERRGVACRDTSKRAIMKMMRAKKKKEREEKLARGEAVDAVSAASKKRSGPRTINPQIRYSCEDVTAFALGDRERPPAKGRWMFVMDSEAHPVRHVSYRRRHRTRLTALKDAASAVAALTAEFGEPHQITKPLPAAEGTPLAKYDSHRYTWRWTDLEVQLSLVSYGRGGIDVYEMIGIPWPVKSDWLTASVEQ